MERVTHDLDAFRKSLVEDGFCLCASLFKAEEISNLREALTDWCDHRAITRGRLAGGIRLPLRECSPAMEASGFPTLRAHVEVVLGEEAFPVRAILFDKTPEANWKVAWHQDLTIAVAEKREAAGFTAWSEKDGVCHVQPPTAILERMLTARIHLDPCGPENGPLRILPASHRKGRLSPTVISELRATGQQTVCTAEEGDALFMRPLILHASSPASNPAHRRVLHIEYSADFLPDSLQWHDR